MEERFFERRFYAVRHEDDETVTIDSGRLIPVNRFKYTQRPQVVPIPVTNLHTGERYWLLLLLSIMFLVVVGAGTFQMIGNPTSLVASVLRSTAVAPTIVIEHPYTGAKRELQYGTQLSFAEPYFFNEVRDGLIDSKQTFLEINLEAMEIRHFSEGVLTRQIAITSKAALGSWGEAPPGVFRVSSMNKDQFSNIGQIYLPYYIAFQGSVAIHGTPHYDTGAIVDDTYRGGSVRVSDDDAAYLYGVVEKGTPVIVHDVTTQSAPALTYEPKVSGVGAPEYLIADISGDTILAAKNIDTKVPIASLTKLMTALVVAEHMNLDEKIKVKESSLVHSLIPRLKDQSTISVYNLLQLLLTESSNEAAEVLASRLGRETFIALMNDRAATLGLTQTTFADPSGLSADNTSTVRDLLRLTQHIYETRRFILELSAKQDLSSAYVSNQFGELLNFNPLDDDDSFIGGKIGETIAAGQTSVSLHEVLVSGQARVMAIIVLGSASRSDDVRTLLSYVEEQFANTQPAE